MTIFMKLLVAVGATVSIALTVTVATAQSGATPKLRDNPNVERCLFMALRRQDPKLNAIITHVEEAAFVFDAARVTDIVAECRAAIAAFPLEPQVIIAHYTAIEAMQMLLFGLKEYPADDQAAVAMAEKTARSSTPILTKLAAFFLGSAYAYGIGTEADRATAMRWYKVAADAGDLTAKREFDRLNADSAPVPSK